MRDRSIRSLAYLQGTASTSRTLNLHAVWERFGGTHAHSTQPFFRSPVLNRAIILKHRMRRGEADVFSGPRAAGTKVILPLDPRNLKAGGRYFFVGQRGYSAALRTLLGDEDAVDSRDGRLLSLLAETRSFDPFLLKLAMKRRGLAASPCYFHVSDADTARMHAFVQDELRPLVGVSFDGDIDFVSRTAALAAKIMAHDVDAELEPLRHTLKLDALAFDEGVFCWRGFIYYKWSLADVAPRLGPVLAEIGRIRTRDLGAEPVRQSLRRARRSIRLAAEAALRHVEGTIRIYDQAFEQLACERRPQAFREFLIGAPDLFADLGERLSALNHIASFWRFRFPPNEPCGVGADELLDILAEFETSLTFGDGRDRAAA